HDKAVSTPGSASSKGGGTSDNPICEAPCTAPSNVKPIYREEKSMSIKKIGLFFSIMIVTMLMLAACNYGKTDIAIGPPAGETNTFTTFLFEAYDIGEGVYVEFQVGFVDAVDAVQDGNIDVSIGILELPAGSIQNLHA